MSSRIVESFPLAVQDTTKTLQDKEDIISSKRLQQCLEWVDLGLVWASHLSNLQHRLLSTLERISSHLSFWEARLASWHRWQFHGFFYFQRGAQEIFKNLWNLVVQWKPVKKPRQQVQMWAFELRSR